MDKEKQLAINEVKAELTRLKRLVAQDKLTEKELTILSDIQDLINELDKIAKDLSLDAESVVKQIHPTGGLTGIVRE
ncbi:MAG: hypothetical protein WC981_04310 [Candidatus Dojkabacteria bacterium]